MVPTTVSRLSFCVLLALFAPAQAQESIALHWSGDLDPSCLAAKADRKPLVIAFLDGSTPDSAAFAADVLGDPRLVVFAGRAHFCRLECRSDGRDASITKLLEDLKITTFPTVSVFDIGAEGSVRVGDIEGPCRSAELLLALQAWVGSGKVEAAKLGALDPQVESRPQDDDPVLRRLLDGLGLRYSENSSPEAPSLFVLESGVARGLSCQLGWSRGRSRLHLFIVLADRADFLRCDPSRFLRLLERHAEINGPRYALSDQSLYLTLTIDREKVDAGAIVAGFMQLSNECRRTEDCWSETPAARKDG